MRRISTSIAVVFSILLFVSICLAQQTATTAVPNLIRYSGTLKNAETTAITPSTVGVTFSMYKQQDGGAPVWMETQNVTTDASGNYSVVLGSTTSAGLPSDLFSQEEQRWLGVQVQGQAEQPRVLLVSVPYAFKAHEAETLAGKRISDFVLAKDLNSTNSAAGSTSTSASGPTQATAGRSDKSPSNLAASAGPTNFGGTTADQIVRVTQSGTGNGIVASTSSTTTSTNALVGSIPGAGVAIFGHASTPSAQGYGIEGVSDSTIGVGLLGFATATTGSTYGLKGYSSSTGGTGVRGLSTATTGVTTGISASVASAAGTAGVFNNTAGGKILSGQNNGTEKFSVDGSGNVNSTSGTYRIGGSSVVSIGSSADGNLFLGVGAGANNVAGQGKFNVFSGYWAGLANTTGSYNAFYGRGAGYSNTTGHNNSFVGDEAGRNNTTGSFNTFYGSEAGYDNTTGTYNTFSGTAAGTVNTSGSYNAFSGNGAGYSNTTGSYNTFSGYQAGLLNTTGSNNIFVGANVGYYGGNNDIYIGNEGPSDTESNTIRIGTSQVQTKTYIAGIVEAGPIQGELVNVDLNTGQLGLGGFSLRGAAEQIADMGDSTNALMKLRPVTFLYKPEYDKGERTLQYGLIAEEVAKVYPDMVAYDKNGQPYTVKYQYLAPMLLNEVQKQHTVVAAQQDVIKTQQEQINEMQKRLSRLETLVEAQVKIAEGAAPSAAQKEWLGISDSR